MCAILLINVSCATLARHPCGHEAPQRLLSFLPLVLGADADPWDDTCVHEVLPQTDCVQGFYSGGMRSAHMSFNASALMLFDASVLISFNASSMLLLNACKTDAMVPFPCSAVTYGPCVTTVCNVSTLSGCNPCRYVKNHRSLTILSCRACGKV